MSLDLCDSLFFLFRIFVQTQFILSNKQWLWIRHSPNQHICSAPVVEAGRCFTAGFVNLVIIVD